MRPYTGWDGNATGRRPGLEQLVDSIEAWTAKGLWNNGTWGVRDKRGKQGNPSVHSTARACDLSWRDMGRKGCGDYNVACQVLDFLTQYADDLLIEAMFDYYPRPYGRGWKCDRREWTNYSSRAFSGSPGGDWIHLEIAPTRADDADWYQKTFDRCLHEWLQPAITEFIPAPIHYTKEYAMRLVTPPVRVADTRKTGSLKAGETATFKIVDSAAAFVNLTVVPKGTPGYLTAFAGKNQPDVSNVNFGTDPICNTSWVPVDASCIKVFASADCDLIIDLQATAN